MISRCCRSIAQTLVLPRTFRVLSVIRTIKLFDQSLLSSSFYRTKHCYIPTSCSATSLIRSFPCASRYIMADTDNPMSTNNQDSRAKRKRKGKKGKKGEPKEPKSIKFDKVDRPIGVWASIFANDIGRIVRNNIKITYQDWSLVPEGIKDTVWQEAKKEWNITDEEMRENVLKIAGERLRGWRTYMTSYFVFKTRKQRRKVPINDPSTIYDGITKEDWAQFVRQRMDEKFQEKSKKARESQKNNLHPHYMGRTGYAGKLPQWHKEEVEAILSSNPAADPVATHKSVAKRLEDRGYAWIKGHTPSLKNPPEQTQKLIEEIKHWKKMEEKGEFVPTRKEDVLVKAMGKPEHCGRTRGVGSRVGIQSYFGKPTSRRRPHETLYTENDLMMFKEEVKKETMTQMNDIVNQKVSEIYKKLKLTLPPELEKTTHLDQLEESTNLDQSSVRFIEPNDPFLELQSPVPCRLVVYGIDSEIIVAEGTAWPWKEGTMVHNTPLSQQNVRVSIDNILDGKSVLPVPWDENVRVAEVFGSFAQWPKSLVLLENKEDNPNEKLKDHAKSKDPKECDNDFQHGDDTIVHLNKDEDKSMEVNSKGTKASSTTAQHGNKECFEKKGPLSVNELSELGQHCQRLERNICSAILGEHSLFNIKISKLVYAYEQDIEQLMLFEDIREMFRYYCLNITMLQVWGSFLYEYATQFKEKLPVGFLCPDKLCTYTRAPLDMEEYVTNALKKQEKNRYIMGAFREGYHWMLLVFDIGENILYIFDSAQTPRKKYLIKTSLQEAWIPYCFMAGRRHPYKKNHLQVKIIDCPQRPNNYECAYYVMKWMWDITVHHSISKDNLEKCVSGSAITLEEINEVRELWALYCRKNI